MELYVAGYHNVVLRFLHAAFIQMPLELWFRLLTAYWPSSTTFNNYTNVSDAVILQQWQAAQQAIGAAQWPASIGGPLQPPDPRALTVQPKNISVISVADVPIADLVKVNPAWSVDKDPSGVILFPNGFGYTPCHSIALTWHKPRVYAAASQVPNALNYEFQNLILNELGYSTEGR
jgi:hypothetical protein